MPRSCPRPPPVNQMPSPAWLKELYDYVRSLEVINTPTIRATHRDRGTELHAIGGGGGGAGAIEIPEWDGAESYSAGDLVCRTSGLTATEGIGDTGPSVIDDGNSAGIWEARTALLANAHLGPSLDEDALELWRPVGPFCSYKLRMAKGNAFVEFDVGRNHTDGEEKPSVSFGNDTYGRVLFESGVLHGYQIRFKEVAVCVNKQRYYTIIPMGPLYSTPLADAALAHEFA